MAYRGYELNLMLRVQDRATSRLRRIAADIGGINRASEFQRQGARIAQQQSRNLINQARTLEAIESREAELGTRKLTTEAQYLRLEATEIDLQEKLARLEERKLTDTSAYASAQKRIEAVELDQIRLLETQRIEREKLVALAAAQVEEERALAAESARVAALQRAAARQEKAVRSARTVMHGGSVAAMAGGIGLLATAGVSAAYASFNRLSVGAATQMRGVNAPLADTAKLAKLAETGLLDMTREFPASADEMAAALYDIASGMNLVESATNKGSETQQRYNQSMRILRMANQVAIAGNLDLATATDVLITTFNNFDPKLQRSSQILNQLFAIVRFGKGTFAAFAPQIGRLAASANAAGQSLTETGSALAFLSQRMPVSQATTALTRIFQIIGRKEFTAGFQQIFKVSPFKEGTRQLKDLSELMFIIEKQGPRIWKGFSKGSVDVMNVLQNITATGQDVIKGKPGHTGLQSTEFARKAVTNLVLFGDQYRTVLSDVTGDTTEFQRSLDAFRNQPGVQWQIAINQFKALAIVLGQDALPQLLRFIDYITHLVHRFQDLSPHTRHLIGMFTVWGSVILLVGGAITTIIGGFGLLIARLMNVSGVLGGGSGGVIGKMTKLWRMVGLLAGVGSIALIIQAKVQGDPSAKQLLQGALMGALTGAGVSGGNPFAAAAGAIAVPVAMEIAGGGGDFGKKISDIILEQTAKGAPKARAYGEYLARMYREGISKGAMTRSEFDKFNKTFEAVDIVENNRVKLSKLTNEVDKTKQTILDKWRDLAVELTGIDLFGGATSQAAQAAINISLALKKAQASGDNPAIRRAIAAQLKNDKQHIAQLEKIKKLTPEQAKLLGEYYDDVTSLNSQIAAMDAAQERATKKTKKATAAQVEASKRVQDRQQAQRAQTEKIKSATDNLIAKYKELEQANKAAFAIFSGPISRGPIVSMFNTINQTLMGLGQKPIAIPIQFQIQDIKAQVANFTTFTNDLDKLRKRGLPQELINELQAKGPDEGLATVEGLVRGPTSAINQYLSLWKNGQKLATDVTGKQMTANLKMWKGYGKGIAWQIIQGLADDKSQATLRAGYKNYITDTFKDILAQELRDATKTKAGDRAARDAAKGKGKPKAPKTPTPTRTTQSHNTTHYHGDEINIEASGATATAVKSAIDRSAADKRNRR